MSSVPLLQEDGTITDQFESVLKQIFSKYCTPSPTDADPLSPPPNACLTSTALDKWAIDTNGTPLPDEQKEEIKEFMDVNEEGNLTFKGFLQIYQLQTESDEGETWRDLQKHGFDRNLSYVPPSSNI